MQKHVDYDKKRAYGNAHNPVFERCVVTMKGNNLAEYMTGTVSDRAARNVEQQHVVHLSVRDQMNLLNALELPEREPNERMKTALKDYNKALEEGLLIVSH